MDSYKEGEYEVNNEWPEIERSRPTWVDVLIGAACALLVMAVFVLLLFLFFSPSL